MSINFLTSKKLRFRPYEDGDLKFLYQWFNDPRVTYYMFTGQRPKTEDQIKELIKSDLENPHNVIFIVTEIGKEEPIGIVGLYEINETAKKAEMRIIIGNKDYWGQGLGTEITNMINYYGFDRLNLNRIYLGFTENNKAAEKAYMNAGYQKEGVLIADIYRNSEYYNSVRMAILRDDYYENYFVKHKKYISI